MLRPGSMVAAEAKSIIQRYGHHNRSYQRATRLIILALVVGGISLCLSFFLSREGNPIAARKTFGIALIALAVMIMAGSRARRLLRDHPRAIAPPKYYTGTVLGDVLAVTGVAASLGVIWFAVFAVLYL